MPNSADDELGDVRVYREIKGCASRFGGEEEDEDEVEDPNKDEGPGGNRNAHPIGEWIARTRTAAARASSLPPALCMRQTPIFQILPLPRKKLKVWGLY